MAKAHYPALSTRDVELFVGNIPDLAWSDFIEVRPGKWLPADDSIDKIERLREWARIRLEEIDAEEIAAKATAEAQRRKNEETWFPARLLVDNEGWIDNSEGWINKKTRE